MILPSFSAPLFQADALSDLQTTNNKLSVWIIDDDRSNVQHVIAALAANSDSLSNIDYALISESILNQMGIRLEHTKGDSADEEVNGSYHRDVVELSAQRLVELAGLIHAKAERNRISEKHVKGLLAAALETGRLDRTRVRLKPAEIEKLSKID